jgi:hypothetical protein
MKLTSTQVSVKYNAADEGIITVNVGDFEGISFKYGRVSIDTDEQGEPVMSFGYDVLSELKPNNVNEFQDSIAHLLHEMILEQIESGELQYAGGAGPSLDDVNELLDEGRAATNSKIESATARAAAIAPHNEATNLLANLGRQPGEMRAQQSETASSFLDRLAHTGMVEMHKEKNED